MSPSFFLHRFYCFVHLLRPSPSSISCHSFSFASFLQPTTTTGISTCKGGVPGKGGKGGADAPSPAPAGKGGAAAPSPTSHVFLSKGAAVADLSLIVGLVSCLLFALL